MASFASLKRQSGQWQGRISRCRHHRSLMANAAHFRSKSATPKNDPNTVARYRFRPACGGCASR